MTSNADGILYEALLVTKLYRVDKQNHLEPHGSYAGEDTADERAKPATAGALSRGTPTASYLILFLLCLRCDFVATVCARAVGLTKVMTTDVIAFETRSYGPAPSASVMGSSDDVIKQQVIVIAGCPACGGNLVVCSDSFGGGSARSGS